LAVDEEHPEEHCKNKTGGVAIAAAACPVLASDEKAIPREVNVTSGSPPAREASCCG
jgi:hypothetical protein